MSPGPPQESFFAGQLSAQSRTLRKANNIASYFCACRVCRPGKLTYLNLDNTETHLRIPNSPARLTRAMEPRISLFSWHRLISSICSSTSIMKEDSLISVSSALKALSHFWVFKIPERAPANLRIVGCGLWIKKQHREAKKDKGWR